MPPVTFNEAYMAIRRSKVPQVVYASRGALNITSVTGVRGKDIMQKKLHDVIGVYDSRVSDSFIEEDFSAWVKKFRPLEAR